MAEGAAASSRLPKHFDDFVWAMSVAAGDRVARSRFNEAYGPKILHAVSVWCRPFCGATCRLRGVSLARIKWYFQKKPTFIVEQNCDNVLDGYVYLLDQLENVIVKRYRGEVALSDFLYPVLHTRGKLFNATRIGFIRHKKGRVALPVWADALTKADREILNEMLLGHDLERIALHQGRGMESVQEAAQRIREAALSAGWKKYWWLFSDANGREVQISPPLDGDGEHQSESPESYIADTNSPSPEEVVIEKLDRSARLTKAILSLPPTQRVALTMSMEEYSLLDIAKGLGISEERARLLVKNALLALRLEIGEEG